MSKVSTPLDGVHELDYDISRADLMTPFSLSLAAERAIESAKRQLDAMDDRLLKARVSMSRVQQTAQRSTSSPLGAIATSKTSGSQVQRSNSLGYSTEDDLGPKTIEMKRLRDDLKDLRSRMSHARSLAGTLSLTPPRPQRPRDHQLPDLANLGAQYQDSTTAPLSPLYNMSSRRSQEFGSPKVPLYTHDTELPMIAATADNPFSPRPYSSQSILTPLHAPTTTIQSDLTSRPAYSRFASVASQDSFVTANEPSTPSLRRTSGGSSRESDLYGDPDTSVESLTPTKQSPSGIPRRPASRLHEGATPAAKFQPRSAHYQHHNQYDTDEQILRAKVEALMSRLSFRESQGRKKLVAVLAILEHGEDDLRV